MRHWKNMLFEYVTYIAQLLWVIAAQLNALLGRGDFPLPDPQTLFMQGFDPPTTATIAARLKGGDARAAHMAKRSASSGAGRGARLYVNAESGGIHITNRENSANPGPA